MKLAEEKFSIISKEDSRSRCNNACQCEQNYLRLGAITDNISEQVVVNLQDSEKSSCRSSEDEEEEEGVAEEEEEEDGELSGMEAF
jgi:hypothetical protein